jgi:MFS superfamily sulfate permease-like transporter
VTKYISEVIVQGFTCGAAYHIILSQMGSLIGFKIPTVIVPVKLFGVSISDKIIILIYIFPR